MGSIRRRLTIAALLAMPSSAMADICAIRTPDWDGTQQSAWAELLNSLQSPMTLFLIITTAVVIKFRSQWGGLAIVVAWSGLIAILMASESYWEGVAEGCIGSPSLFFGLIGALCIGVVLYTAPLPKKPDS